MHRQHFSLCKSREYCNAFPEIDARIAFPDHSSRVDQALLAQFIGGPAISPSAHGLYRSETFQAHGFPRISHLYVFHGCRLTSDKPSEVSFNIYRFLLPDDISRCRAYQFGITAYHCERRD